MLSQRTINAIFLLHEAGGFKLLSEENTRMPYLAQRERNDLIQTLIRKGYLDSRGMLRHTLDEISLLDLLCDLEEKIDPTTYNRTLPRKTEAIQTNSLHTLERSSILWLKSIKLNQL